MKRRLFSIRFLKLNRSGIIELVIDAILLAIALSLAFGLRYDFDIPAQQISLLQTYILPVIIIKLAIFYLSGTYQRMWRYADVEAFFNIVVANVVGALAVAVLLFFFSRVPMARGVVAFDGVLSLLLTVGARAVVKGFREIRSRRFWKGDVKHVLIAGAGDTGAAIITEILNRPELALQPVGVIDDDPLKQARYVRGVRVLGTRKDLVKILRDYQVQEVIICMPSVSREVIRDIFFQCQKAGVQCRTLPGVYQIISGVVGVASIKDVDVEDILGREPIKVDLKTLSSYIAGKVVMVAGAAGSIGNELSRQLSYMRPASLILVDQNESGIYDITQELETRKFPFPVTPVIADITHRDRIMSIFTAYKPSIVFHAAAYKHVPLMESNLIEAVENNIFGTKILCEAALQFNTERLVFISTDKAVEPISVMGKTKALAERLVQSFSQRSTTKFAIVRFGNVLDSSGSVVPIFRRQIAQGGPVTVTDPEMIRYFMTIPEATQLVIQAGFLGGEEKIFVLDMGEQMSVFELAKTMITLSGLEPEKDIPIVFTGVRPGEKLQEKLSWDEEEVLSTEHPKIMAIRNTKSDITQFEGDLLQLEGSLKAGNQNAVGQMLNQMCVYHLGKMPPKL